VRLTIVGGLGGGTMEEKYAALGQAIRATKPPISGIAKLAADFVPAGAPALERSRLVGRRLGGAAHAHLARGRVDRGCARDRRGDPPVPALVVGHRGCVTRAPPAASIQSRNLPPPETAMSPNHLFRDSRRFAAVLLCAGAVALAGCGGGGGDDSGSVDPCSVPGLDRLCPVEYPTGPFPIGAPSIQSFTVSPAEIRPGDAVTITAQFSGSGYVIFVGLSGSITLTSGTPVTVASPLSVGPVEQPVRLTVSGLVEDPPGVWTWQVLTETVTVAVLPP